MSHHFNMRSPRYADYDDFLSVEVRRRSIKERFYAILWLLFSNWRSS